ncbi:FliA/WhiG family RNA polymerase sigma factor [bacterium]|nr:FliA/WhiG family RNA polymerase sigma factor [bacterium]
MTRAERERLIADHIRLVHQIVGRIGAHLPETVEREDLVSAGILGLIKAVDRYDPGRGAKLATYASSVIKGEIMEWLRSKDWAPRSVRRRARELATLSAGLEYELGRAPTEAEIAEAMGVDIDQYRKLLDETSAAAVLSLEETLAGVDDEREPPSTRQDGCGEFADPALQVENEDVRRVLVGAVERLPERERQVVGMYYQEGLTLKEIGAVLGVTESRVCQIHSQAIARLRGVAARELLVAVPH